MLELVTGYQGKDHITPQQQSDLQRGTFGGNYRLDVGSQMEAYIDGSEVVIPDGVVIIYGREFYIHYGETERVNLESGATICIQYHRNADTDVESCEFISLTNYNEVDLRTEPTLSQIPFCAMSGSSVEMLIDVSPSLKEAVDIVKNTQDAADKAIADAQAAADAAQAAADKAEEAAEALLAQAGNMAFSLDPDDFGLNITIYEEE